MELAGRNRMWRYMAMQMIRNDPAWKNGDYTTEPVEGLRGANDLIIIAGSAPLQMQKNYPTRASAEGYVDRTLDSLDRAYRRQQLSLLRQRVAQLQSGAEAQHHHRSRALDQLRR